MGARARQTSDLGIHRCQTPYLGITVPPPYILRKGVPHFVMDHPNAVSALPPTVGITNA